MHLGNSIKNLDKKYQKIFFSGISFESSKVQKDYIFFAIKGNKLDGNNFIHDAIKKGGASAVLAASIFHYGEYTIKESKEYLKSRNVPIRL